MYIDVSTSWATLKKCLSFDQAICWSCLYDHAKLQNYRTDVDNLLQSNNGGLPVGPIYEPFFEPILGAAASKATVGRLKK